MFKLSITYPQYSSSILLDSEFPRRQMEIHHTGKSISILTARRARLKIKKLQYAVSCFTMMIDQVEELIQDIRQYKSSLRALEERLLTNQHVEQEEFDYLTQSYLTSCELKLSALYNRYSDLWSDDRLSLNSRFDQVSLDIRELDQIIMKLQEKYEGYLSGKFHSKTLIQIYTFKYKEKLKDVEYGDRIMTLDNRYIFYCDLDNPPFILWDITNRSVFKTFDREVKNINKIVPAPNHYYIAMSTNNKFLLWYFKDDRIIEIDNPYTTKYVLDITSDSKCIISISTKYICIWSPSSKRLINRIDTQSSNLIYKSALSSDDEYLAISDVENNIEIWSLKLNRRINYIKGDEQGPEVVDLKFAYKDSYLIVAYGSLILVWNIKKKRYYNVIGLQYSSVDFRAVIQDRYIFYHGFMDIHYYHLWDLKRKMDLGSNFSNLRELEMIIGDSTVFFSSTHLHGLHIV
jgi:WD40 repeat protein